MATTGPIGGDWVANWDPNTSRFYFANTDTQATTWEWPEGLPKPGLSVGGWMCAEDPNTGNRYYSNPEEDPPTTWSVPEAVVRAVINGGEGTPTPSDAETPKPTADAKEKVEEGKAEAAAAEEGEAKPADKAEAPKANGGGAAAPAAAEAPAPAPAESAAKAAMTRLSASMRGAWMPVLRHAARVADEKISTRNAKFERLRQFNKVRARKRKQEAERKAAVAAAAAEEEAREKAAEAAAAQRSVMSMLTIKSLDEPEPKSMEDYAEQYFNLDRKGLFRGRTTVEKVLAWKPKMIRMALKQNDGSINNAAIQCFRNITGFMGDRSSGKEDGGHAEKLLKNSLHAPEELRDEVYCQLVKQTTSNHSDNNGLLKGWQLFAVVSGGFPPSVTLAPYIESYCWAAMQAHEPAEDGNGVREFAEYTLGRIRKIAKLGPRREIPTSMEVEGSKVMQPVLVRVFLLDGSSHYMPVTSWTTPNDLRDQMTELLGVKEENQEAFAIYEMTPDNEERYLENDERILDLVAYWQRLFEEEKQKDAKKEGSQHYRVVFKVHMYFTPPPEDSPERDLAAEKMLYIQAVYDVVSARYPCGEEDSLTLAALQRQVEKPGLPLVKDHLARYLHTRLATGKRKNEMVTEVNKRHDEIKEDTPSKCRRKYLEHVMKWKIYGSSFFYVEPQMNAVLPDEIFLAVNPKGVLLINPETKAVVAEHPYSEIPTWGHSGSSFVLHIGNLLKQSKLYFRTEQGKEINDLVRAYVEHLVAMRRKGQA